jgi:hypothetical protein
MLRRVRVGTHLRIQSARRSALRGCLQRRRRSQIQKDKLAQRQKTGPTALLAACNKSSSRKKHPRTSGHHARACDFGFVGRERHQHCENHADLVPHAGARDRATGCHRNQQARYSQPISGWSGSAVWPAMVSSFEQTTKLGPCYSSKSTHETGLPGFGNPKSCRIARNETSG